MKINSFIFDVDSCIVNFHKYYHPIVDEIFLKKFNVKIADWQLYRGLAIPDIIRKLGIKVSHQRARRIELLVTEKCQYLIENEIRFPLAKQELFYKLKAENYKLAVCSSLPAQTVYLILKTIHCADYFDFIFSSDDLTYLPPSPYFYEPAFSALGELGDCVVVFPGSPQAYKAAKESPGHVVIMESASGLDFQFIQKTITDLEKKMQDAANLEKKVQGRKKK